MTQDMFKAGVSEAVISPPIGIYLGGFASRVNPSIGIHDDLKVRALALEMAEESGVIVSCDLLGLGDEMIKAIREIVALKTGLAGDRVLIAATHTHSGPDMVIPFREDADEAWLEVSKLQIAGCAVSAYSHREEALVASGSGEVNIGFNRRREGGPIDPQLCLLRVDRTSGHPLAVVLNYACHGVVLGSENLYISADYLGFAVRNLENFMNARGKRLKGIFFNGACGDVNPETCKGYACPGTFEDADRLGSIVAAETIKVYEGLKPRESERFKMTSLGVDLPVRDPPPLSEAEEKLRKIEVEASSPLDAQLLYAREEYLLAVKGLRGCVRGEVQALAIGDTAMVTLPGEALVSLGLGIKKSSPFATTFILGYGNGYLGYIASEEDFNLGGYETRLARWSFLKPEAYNILLEAATKALASLTD